MSNLEKVHRPFVEYEGITGLEEGRAALDEGIERLNWVSNEVPTHSTQTGAYARMSLAWGCSTSAGATSFRISSAW